MQEKFDRRSRRPGMEVALLILVALLAGCLDAAEEPPDGPNLIALEDLLPEWRHTTGPLFLRADLPGDGSHCKFHAVARGTSETLEPVIAMAATRIDLGDGSPPGSHFHFWSNNDVSSGIPIQTTVVAADEMLINERTEPPSFHSEWIMNVTFSDFESIEAGVAWISISNLAVHDANPYNDRIGYQEERDETSRLHDYLKDTTVDASLTCGDTDIPFTVAHGTQAIMFTGPPSSGAAHVWSRAGGVSAAFAGADNNIEWTATNESWFFGKVGGDPTKAVVVTLDHPGGLTPWLALPTTYGGTGIGDVFMEHQGGPGDYRLSGTGGGTGLFSWSGLVIFD